MNYSRVGASAILDNVVQALFLTSFFIWLEVLFCLGYRPGLKGRLDVAVREEMVKFRTSKRAKGNVNGKVFPG